MFEIEYFADYRYEVWHASNDHEEDSCPCVEQKHHEELSIFVANAGVQPRAVMIHVQNASVTC